MLGNMCQRPERWFLSHRLQHLHVYGAIWGGPDRKHWMFSIHIVANANFLLLNNGFKKGQQDSGGEREGELLS